MPSLTPYNPVPFIKGPHLETMIPGLLRQPKNIVPVKEKISTKDNDFLELDWYRIGSNTLVILSHGLEGNSNKAYMKGMAKIFNDNNIDALCWNYRGCGSELNRQPKLYHSGATHDLDTVVRHATNEYKQLVLIGFSLGGNITLKYAGEQGRSIDSKIKTAIAFSTPLDLDAGCRQISTLGNWHYAKRFINKLKRKIKIKHRQYPDVFTLNGLDKINDLRTFDDQYTGPIHGFVDAADYYAKCSAINFLKQITIPALIVNAKNDPFLPDECYPYDISSQNTNITFEAPDHGGHVGFMELNKQGYYWSEKRALAFVRQQKIL